MDREMPHSNIGHADSNLIWFMLMQDALTVYVNVVAVAPHLWRLDDLHVPGHAGHAYRCSISISTLSLWT